MTINSNANHPLTIFSWNANGLRKHLDELQHILTETNTDIALISETHFTPTSCVKMYGFNSYYSCHPDGTAHAGSAIYIKSSIPHHLLTFLPTYKHAAFQLLLIITYLLPYPQFIVLQVSSPLSIISLNTFLHWDIASSREVTTTQKIQHGEIALQTLEAEHYSAV